MRAAAWIVIGVALVLASGCAKQDWIDRTLVTVDVTGVWEGAQTGPNYVNPIELVLRQEGAKVTGWMTGGEHPLDHLGDRIREGTAESPIPIEGRVSGDTFSFHEVSGMSVHVQVQVNGDEMTGSGSRLTPWTIALHRRPPQ